MIEVRCDADAISALAMYDDNHGLTRFNAIHFFESSGARIISTDSPYDAFHDRPSCETTVDP